MVEADGLWSIAMLRIAMELKRRDAPGLPEIIAGVVRRMGIDQKSFEKYLTENFGLLEETARIKGYVKDP